MPISSINSASVSPIAPIAATPATVSRWASTTAAPVDTFERVSIRSNSDHPITDAWMANIKAPGTPVSEKITLALLTPIIIPITAALDVILYPLIKIGQFTDWVKSKFS